MSSEPHQTSALSGLPEISLFTTSERDDTTSTTRDWQAKAHKTLFEALRELRVDHSSGAKQLATRAVGFLVQIARIIEHGFAEKDTFDDDTFPIWWDATRRTGWALATHGRPSMGAAITVAILNALEQGCLNVQRASRAPDAFTDANLIRTGLQAMEEYLHDRLNCTNSHIGRVLKQFIENRFSDRMAECKVTILTLSLSSTVRDALTTILQADAYDEVEFSILLRILESRPLCEGANLANFLLTESLCEDYSNRLTIEVASDASMAVLAKNVDIVLLGADRISESGDVSNKIGSLPAVLCTKSISKDAVVIALSDIEKIAKPGKMEEHVEEENDPAELMNAWDVQVRQSIEREIKSGAVKIRNPYFEWVPADYIDFYISNNGVLSKTDIKLQSEWVVKSERTFFGDVSGWHQ